VGLDNGGSSLVGVRQHLTDLGVDNILRRRTGLLILTRTRQCNKFYYLSNALFSFKKQERKNMDDSLT
jgi:hypothetical protein